MVHDAALRISTLGVIRPPPSDARMTPAMAASIEHHEWSIDELVALLEAREAELAAESN